ncbi:type III secretion system domain-containing protein [uncultured Shewanella sp.]|uniref:type III secretion system domain-containing protein n=1 Tax=uncultured Shewanella sp. TaxID=173975 RepID=UPI002635C91E|nr:type III secretion system domain-containing protein [uncultured Shewanella sp.]
MAPEDKRLNEFMWQPCATMHPSWWQALGLEKWQTISHRSRLLNQRVNKLAVSVLPPFDRSMKLNLTEQDKILLNMGERLLVLLTGVGLVLLNSPDYITMRQYREALLNVFTYEQIQQMLSLWPEGGEVGDCSAEDLIETAQHVAIKHFNVQWEASQVWQALKPTLPFVSEDGMEETASSPHDAKRWLFRLERFI